MVTVVKLVQQDSIMSATVIDQIPYALVLLGLASVIGICGNILVIIVYSREAKKQTAYFFIYVLAWTDLLTCLAIIPFTMVNEALLWRIKYDPLCKLYTVLNTSSASFSSLIITAIAVDRYLCICQPFLKLMTVPRAKMTVIFLAIVALVIGGPTAVFSRVQLKSENNTTETFNSTKTSSPECSDLWTAGKLSSNGSSSLQWVVFQIVQKANHGIFLICIGSVLGLYMLIYVTIVQVRKKRSKLLGKCPRKTPKLSQPPSNNSQGIHEHCTTECKAEYRNGICVVKSNTLEAKSKSEEINGNVSRSQASSNSRAGEQRDEEAEEEEEEEEMTFLNNTSNRIFTNRCVPQSLQNFKTAVILFVVAVVYILTYTPAVLMANKIIPLHLVCFYLYYVNNAANPIIYGFMNPTFRVNVRKLCSRSREN